MIPFAAPSAPVARTKIKGRVAMARDLVKIDVRRLVFPLIAGRKTAKGFERVSFAGTGFFVGQRGLALTAAHVIRHEAGIDLAAALPGADRPMKSHSLLWGAVLPNSDIAIVRIAVEQSTCFAVRFQEVLAGENVETTAIPESMLKTDEEGRTQVSLRCVKGYVSYGFDDRIFASFPLPRGMSGAPVIVNADRAQFVAGVFVGQHRGEQIEDSFEEVIEGAAGERRTQVERVSRVEYFARGDLLVRHRTLRVKEFDGMNLEELIAAEVTA